MIVLVIEDNPDNMELMRFLLAAAGHDVHCAFSGENGVAMARAEDPEAVLLDIHMPGMDGFETLRRLREHDGLGPVPVIAITAFAMEDDRERILAAGFDGYISKPITPETFVSEIENLIALPAV